MILTRSEQVNRFIALSEWWFCWVELTFARNNLITIDSDLPSPSNSFSTYYPHEKVSINPKLLCSHPFLSIASTSSTLMPKMKRLSSPASSAISTLAPSMVPIVRAPFNMNFMFPVPEASVPAVEICSDRSAAGIAKGQSKQGFSYVTLHVHRKLVRQFGMSNVKHGYKDKAPFSARVTR